MNREKRLDEMKQYGYATIGEAVDDETIIAKRFDNTGIVLVMAIHDNYVSQIRFTSEQFEALQQFRE